MWEKPASKYSVLHRKQVTIRDCALCKRVNIPLKTLEANRKMYTKSEKALGTISCIVSR